MEIVTRLSDLSRLPIETAAAPEEEFAIQKVASRDEACALNLSPNDKRTFLLTTVERTSCDAVCVCSHRRGNHILLTHFKRSRIDEHLREIRTKAPKRDITVVMSVFSYFADQALFEDQFKTLSTLWTQVHGEEWDEEAPDFYAFLQRNYPIIEFHGLSLFDLSLELREAIGNLLNVEPVVWHLPISSAAYATYQENPHFFQLVAARTTLKRLIFIPGTNFKLFLD